MASLQFSIDRIEEGMAILIARDDPSLQIMLPIARLPPGSKEGDILTMSLERDEQGTGAAKERVVSLIDKLRKKNT